MKASMMARLLLVLAALMSSLGTRLQVRRAATDPVSKVVNLLNDLAKKAEKNGEREQKLYDKFVCMGKTSIQEKEDFISESEQRISFLESTVAQIAANNASGTQRESKLTEEIATMEADATETAKTSAAQLAAAKAQVNETQEGIAGLTAAVDALSGNAGLLSLKTDTAKSGADLKEALRLGEKYLSKANAFFLRSVLTGHVAPPPAFVQVASPAEERASGIVKTLKGIKEQFSASLDKAKKDAEEAYKLYSELKESKGEQLKAAKDALIKLRLVNAERLKAHSDAKTEIDELKQKVLAEEQFVDEFKKGLAEKEKEFDERTVLRQEELSAISEAITVLRSDEARDVFRKTGTLLQVASDQASEQRRTAAQLLLAVAKHDVRVLDIAKLLSAGSNSTFGNVLTKISTMNTVLEEEQENDLKKREECKDTLAKDKMAMSSKQGAVEDLSLSRESTEREVDAAADRVEKHEAEIKEIQKELEKSQELRDSERKEYLETKQNNNLALSLLAEATKKVSDFYKKGEASLLQGKSKSNPSLDFGASDTSQATGVVQTMEMVADDIKKDIALADKEETAAQALFEENKKSLEEQIVQLKAMKTTLKGQQSSKAQDLVEAKASLRTAKDSLAAMSQKMEASKKGCDSILTDFDKRHKNRQDEIEGLIKAKTVLANA